MRVQGALTSFAMGALCIRARPFQHSLFIKTLALFAAQPPALESTNNSSISTATTDVPLSSIPIATAVNNLSSLSSENTTLINQYNSTDIEEESIKVESVQAVVEEDAYTGLESLSAASLTHLNKIESMKTKYQSKFACTRIPQFPYCDIYLCGTLHVAKTSTDMVIDAIQTLKPHFILLELCEARSESLFEVEQQNVTLRDVIRETFNQRSIKVFGMGLLSWMQMKSANMLGNKLGGEITAAYKISAENGALGVILGDRLYGVTIQRIFDKLSTFEKIKVACIMTVEVLTMSFMKLADYIKKTESDEKFIQEEIARFRKYLPSFASVIIDERDEYLAQSIIEIGTCYSIFTYLFTNVCPNILMYIFIYIRMYVFKYAYSIIHICNRLYDFHYFVYLARVGFGQVPPDFDFSRCPERRGKVLAVLGAGHLEGVQRLLAAGGVSETRLQEISSSSKHNSTWPGRGILQIVNTSPSAGATGHHSGSSPVGSSNDKVSQ